MRRKGLASARLALPFSFLFYSFRFHAVDIFADRFRTPTDDYRSGADIFFSSRRSFLWNFFRPSLFPFFAVGPSKVSLTEGSLFAGVPPSELGRL